MAIAETSFEQYVCNIPSFLTPLSTHLSIGPHIKVFLSYTGTDRSSIQCQLLVETKYAAQASGYRNPAEFQFMAFLSFLFMKRKKIIGILHLNCKDRKYGQDISQGCLYYQVILTLQPRDNQMKTTIFLEQVFRISRKVHLSSSRDLTHGWKWAK